MDQNHTESGAHAGYPGAHQPRHQDLPSLLVKFDAQVDSWTTTRPTVFGGQAWREYDVILLAVDRGVSRMGLQGRLQPLPIQLSQPAVGGAMWAAACAFPPDLIRLLDDWRSNAYMKYIDMSLQDKYDAMLEFNIAMNMAQY